MLQSLAQVRKWLIVGVCVLVATVTLSYWIARSRVGPTLHNIPKELGIDIQQTSDGFSLSKSEGGRTIYTIRASKAVQFKAGERLPPAQPNPLNTCASGMTPSGRSAALLRLRVCAPALIEAAARAKPSAVRIVICMTDLRR